jgi:predicted enzyme related to lactoylglutathione lyase
VSRIVHFEIPTDDRERAKAFYGALFGWRFQDVEGMEYTLVQTAEEGPNGGIVKRSEFQGIVNYVDVDDVREYQHRAEKLGADVVIPCTPIPSVGWYAVLKDLDGNTFAVWHDDEYAGF